MSDESNFGFSQTCPRCGGSGKMKVDSGFIRENIVEMDCSQCKGTGKIFIYFNCPLMSVGKLDTYAHTGYSYYTRCAGESCAFWDHDHGGGCLKRKSMIKDLYGGNK